MASSSLAGTGGIFRIPGQGRRLYLLAAGWTNFAGGLNVRDAFTEMALNETPACHDVTLDERGGAISRLGLTKLNGASLLPATPCYLYYSAVADALLAFISSTGGAAKLYQSTDGGVTWAANAQTFTNNALGAIVDFAGKVVVVSSLDGVYQFAANLASATHTTGGTNNMEVPKGTAVAVWQNKVWVTGNGLRVWFSAAGDATTFAVGTDFVDVRDIDDKPCTAIGAGAGLDITAKPSLLVYKQNSTYRIDDSTTGKYITLHSSGAGAASPMSVASALGAIASINDLGIWVTDGTRIPARVSDKLAPLFTPDGLALGHLANFAAGVYKDRLVFAVTANGASTNNLVLEYHPQIGWIVPHTLSLGAFAAYTKNTRKLISVSATGGKVYETFKGGTDDGTAIPSYLQTSWLPLMGGREASIRSAELLGRGQVNCNLLTNFSTGSGDLYALDFSEGQTLAEWGDGTSEWGDGVSTWGGQPTDEARIYQPLDQTCHHVSLVFSKSVSTTATGEPLLGVGASPQLGEWAVYQAVLTSLPLGT